MESWILYPGFILGDGCQMVNVNILSLVYSLVLWFNILSCRFSKYVVLTNYKKSKDKSKQNSFPNPYLQQYNIYNNLKIDLDYIELKNQKNKKIK
jgi:hypothetical protein